uniref:Uncharacterized protein n=1 Tax=Neisseria meningitidis alpha522 TaxID=996307 RepID=I4E7I6_NEIME|nr:hypothetical protein NMALPHA522_1763 [Neisseria meningitidis alpha522]
MSELSPDSARLQGNRLFPVAWESGVSNKRHFVRLASADIGGISRRRLEAGNVV